MMRALALAALASSACFPFGDALSRCEDAGHCPGVDSGAGGGAGGGSACVGGGTGTGGGSQLSPVVIAGLGNVSPLCTDASFCWQQPLPTGSTIRAVWIFSPNDWWLAGLRGALLHYDGSGLKVDAPAAEPDTTDWWGLWGTSSGDLFAVASYSKNGLYKHHADGGWQSINVGMFDSPVITGNEDAGVVWILAQGSVVKGSPAGGFQSVPLAMSPGRAWGAAGATADSFYAALEPAPYFWNVTSVAGMPLFDGGFVPTTNMLWSMTQHTNGALWVVGDAPDNGATKAFAAQQLSGGGWLELDLNASSNSGRAIAQVSGSDEVIVLTGEGKTYLATPGVAAVQLEREPVNDYDTGLNAVHSAGGIAVGAGVGVITLRDSNGQWATPVPSDYRDLYNAVWKDGVMAAVGYGTLAVVRDGGSWLPVASPDPQGILGIGVLHGALVLSTTVDVFRSNGSGGWVPFGCQPASIYGALAVAGDDVWITADGGIYHATVDAGCAPELVTGDQLVAISAAAPDRVWAVGTQGTAWSRGADGGWTRASPATEDLNDVVVSATGAYAIGSMGKMYNLASGTQVSTECSRAIEVVPTCTGERIYAAGNSSGGPPQLCIIDPGAQPRTLQVPSDQAVNAVRSDGRTLYLFGASHTILTYPLP